MLARTRLAGVVLLAALSLLVGCRATADIAIDVGRDGSGTVGVTVELDRAATAELGADPKAALKVDDLAAAGWDVSGPTVVNGVLSVVLTKEFARPADLPGVLDELGGRNGAFRSWKLTSSDSFTHTDYRLAGRVDLTGSLDQFSDADVATALDGLATGRTPEELTTALKDDPDALSVSVSAGLPGERGVVEGFTVKDPDGEAAVASRRFVLGSGPASSTRLVLESSETERSGALWMLFGAGLVVLAALLVALAVRRPRGARGPAPVRPAPPAQ